MSGGCRLCVGVEESMTILVVRIDPSRVVALK